MTKQTYNKLSIYLLCSLYILNPILSLSCPKGHEIVDGKCVDENECEFGSMICGGPEGINKCINEIATDENPMGYSCECNNIENFYSNSKEAITSGQPQC